MLKSCLLSIVPFAFPAALGVIAYCLEPHMEPPPLKLPDSEPPVLKMDAEPVWMNPSYFDAYVQALKEDKPLVVFVRLKVRQVPGAIVVWVPNFPEQDMPGVVIGIPDGAGKMNELMRVDSFPTAEWFSRNLDNWKAKRRKPPDPWISMREPIQPVQATASC